MIKIKLVGRDERWRTHGSILVWVMVAITLMMSGIIAGFSLIQTTRTTLETHLEYYGQATNIAKAGLLDALAWFRRQTTQPVTVFDPKRDLTADPIINDTDDPAIGIVREIEVDQTADVWGRYEVQTSKVSDVTAERGLAGAGTFWKIESLGIIYHRVIAAQAYNVYPNRVIASIRFATEIRRTSIDLPSISAVCAGDPNQTVIGNGTKIKGGDNLGLGYPVTSPPKSPTVHGEVTGDPPMSPVDDYDDSVEGVFGMSEDELRSIADYYVTSVDDLPVPIPDYNIVFFDGNPTFSSSHPLSGSGILYVTGNMTVGANSNTYWNGIIYCCGNYQQNAPSVINGSLITKNKANFEGSGDITEVNYDANIYQQILTHTGQYRYGKPTYVVEE